MRGLIGICLGVLVFAVGCGDDDAGDDGAKGGAGNLGGSSNGGGSGGAPRGGMGSGGAPREELCGLSGSCRDGVVTGKFGNFCSQIVFTCEAGCDPSPDRPAAPWPQDATSAKAALREALCLAPGAGGAGGGGGQGGNHETGGGGVIGGAGGSGGIAGIGGSAGAPTAGAGGHDPDTTVEAGAGGGPAAGAASTSAGAGGQR